MINFREEEDGALCFDVRVMPRASRSGVAGEHGGALRVRVAAPPVEGAANEELIRTLAKAFGVPARAVEIVSGLSSKNKRVRVHGASAAGLLQVSSKQ
ncbi:MAG TPA: DUF167 domain-containing protein [Pyrinomonadaceae bacterium]|nr:DUF167 domain-containing protein [Pyrinomonadaceae bacterium]